MTGAKKHPAFYEFDGYRFYPDERRLLQNGNKQLWLDPKPSSLLHALIRRGRRLVTHAELKKEVWPEIAHVADRTLHQHKYALSAILGKNSAGEAYIENVSGRGYRFTVEVLENGEAGVEDSLSPERQKADPDEQSSSRSQSADLFPTTHSVAIEGATPVLTARFGGHVSHVMVSCTLYSLLYSVALFIEVAYQYEQFRSSAWAISGVMFLWILSTSILGLRLNFTRTTRRQNKGLLLSIIIFIVSGFVVYAALGLYLPNEPITEARFQTYPAHGAYLKSVYYFLPLALVFIILPFHAVISIEREIRAGDSRDVGNLLGRKRGVAPRGSILLRPWMLGLLLPCAAIFALFATAHLFDNLESSTYMSLFMQLVQLRLVLYFALGLECLLWYSWSLNEIKRKIIKIIQSK